MAKRIRTNKSSPAIYYAAISILLVIIVVLLAYAISNHSQKTVQKTEIVYLYHNYSAAIAVSINYSPYMRTTVLARLVGPGANASAPLILGYTAPYVQEPANSISSNQTLPRLPLLQSAPAELFFGDLKPFSNYTFTISGSSAPVCLPGEVCPMAVGANSTQLPSFVLRVYKNETIKTGANGTQTSVSINLN